MKQTEIPGTEVPKVPEIENALDEWFAAQEEQRTAGETTKIRHASLLLQMSANGIERYPYIDPASGKRKVLVVARDPKAKVINAPKETRRRGEPDEPGEAMEDREVEHRKVSRASVEQELAERDAAVRDADDPLAATREAMEASWSAPQAAADRFMDGVEAMGATVTLTTGGKSVTLGKRKKGAK